MTLELIDKIHSSIDKTIKYVFNLNGQKIEFSYIDNGSDKDIICVPCQTMCNQSCTFCYLTQYVGDVRTNNIHEMFIVKGVQTIVNDLALGRRMLLISFMGAGEPMNNHENIINTMLILREAHRHIRFAVSTILPKNRVQEFYQFVQLVVNHKLNVKLHLSLHYADDIKRRKSMPNALPISVAILCLQQYHVTTNNQIECHYVLMKDVNNSQNSMYRLNDVLQPIKNVVNLKFMAYNDENNNSLRLSMHKVKRILAEFKRNGISSEYYESPGNDINASCGQFILK